MSSMRQIGASWLVWAATVAGCATPSEPAPLPAVELPPALDRVLRDYETAWRDRDADALAALFAEDGFVLSDRSPPVRGREAIRVAYARAGGPLFLEALGYSTEGGTGWIVGAYGHEPGARSGKFVLALKRAGSGPWQIAADIDNSNRR